MATLFLKVYDSSIMLLTATRDSCIQYANTQINSAYCNMWPWHYSVQCPIKYVISREQILAYLHVLFLSANHILPLYKCILGYFLTKQQDFIVHLYAYLSGLSIFKLLAHIKAYFVNSFNNLVLKTRLRIRKIGKIRCRRKRH